MRHWAGNAARWVKISSRLATKLRRAETTNLLLKQTTVGGCTLSTRSLNFFDVILSMIVLSAGQTLHQSSAGRAARAPAKASVASVASLRYCVLLALFLCGVADCPFRFLWALPLTPWSCDKALTRSFNSSELTAFRSTSATSAGVSGGGLESSRCALPKESSWSPSPNLSHLLLDAPRSV